MRTKIRIHSSKSIEKSIKELKELAEEKASKEVKDSTTLWQDLKSIMTKKVY